MKMIFHFTLYIVSFNYIKRISKVRKGGGYQEISVQEFGILLRLQKSISSSSLLFET